MKAVSNVIVVILILMISVTLASLGYIFFLEVTTSTTETGMKAVEKSTSTLLSQMVIESITRDNIYIRNRGKTNLTGFAVYENDKPVNFSGPSVVMPDKLGTINISLCSGLVEVTAAQGIKASKKFEDPGIILCLRFEEGQGTTTTDLVQGLNINLNGNWVEGKYGGAYQFIGAGWVSTNFGTGIGSGREYVFYFRLPDTSDTTGTFFCTDDVSDTNIEDNLGQTTYGNRGCGISWLNAGFNVNDVQWHKFVFTKSSDSTLCLDDNCVNVGDATGNVPNMVRIVFNGGCGCGYSNFAQGIIIDEVRIYS